MSLAAGQRVGPYQVLGSLGAGGMGEVYRARDTRLGREVALKVLPAAFAGDPERLARFQREAEVLASLNHPHIAAIYGLEETEGIRALALELVDGPTLADRIEGGAFPLEDALRIAGEIAEALHAAHRRGVVHRDLKPANVKLTVDGEVKVLDFGLAKNVDPGSVSPETAGDDTVAVTRVGSVVGTAAYMSPEQAAGGSVDQRADLWALGLLLYEMVSGRRAFPGISVPDTLAAVLRAEVDWTALPPDLPREVSDLLRRCLERDPGRRPRDVSEIRSALGIARADASSGTRRPVAATKEEEHSIVVLPFVNSSPDPDNEYFSDGLTEEIIADLSKVGALRVISRTTAMRLKGGEKDLRTISRELGVRYALEGSVRKAGPNLRITAQLVDAVADAPVWSEKYRGTLDDVFEIQERVSRAIVDALRVTLSGEENRKLGTRPKGSGYGYDVFLKARRDILSFSNESLERAVADLRRALAIEPDDLFLLRGMGMAEWQYVNAGLSADLTHLERAESYARRVLELDPEGPHGPMLLGFIAAQRGNRHEWVKQFGRAVELDPNDPDALVWLALGWMFGGVPERGRPYCDRLEVIDPLFDFRLFARGADAMFTGDFREAAAIFRRARELHPEMIGWSMVTAQALLMAGDLEGAAAAIGAGGSDPRSHPMARMGHILVKAAQGKKDEVRDLLDDEYLSHVWNDIQYTWITAQSYALLGDVEEGLKWLRRSVELSFCHYPFLTRLDPLLANLRGDPRFDALMEEVRRDWESFKEVAS